MPAGRVTAAAIRGSRPGYDSQLRVTASYDPTAFRAFWKINGMTPIICACCGLAVARARCAPKNSFPQEERSWIAGVVIACPFIQEIFPDFRGGELAPLYPVRRPRPPDATASAERAARRCGADRLGERVM